MKVQILLDEVWPYLTIHTREVTSDIKALAQYLMCVENFSLLGTAKDGQLTVLRASEIYRVLAQQQRVLAITKRGQLSAQTAPL